MEEPSQVKGSRVRSPMGLNVSLVYDQFLPSTYYLYQFTTLESAKRIVEAGTFHGSKADKRFVSRFSLKRKK
jgi:hypothetical protein